MVPDFCSLGICNHRTRFSHIFECERSGDRFNLVQDHQGVSGGQAQLGYYCGEQASACHIHANWIWDGHVYYPTGSARAWHYEDGRCESWWTHRFCLSNDQREYWSPIILLIFLIKWAWLGCNTDDHPVTGLNGIIFQWPGIYAESHEQFVLCVWRLEKY